MSKPTRNKNLGQKAGKKRKSLQRSRERSENGQNRPDLPKNAEYMRSSRQKRPGRKEFNAPNWLWGHHAVKAALENLRRTHHKLLLTPKMRDRLPEALLKNISCDIIETTPREIDSVLPEGAVHQGAALKTAPLPAYDLEDVADPAQGLLIVLDQITDPHNVGAIFRLAAAFNAKGVIMQSRHAPPMSGAVAKVAVGMIETVPHVLVTNIGNALLGLQKRGWRVTGLAGETDLELETALLQADAEVLVMGAEGPGLRKRVRDCCDQLAKIPMPGVETYGAESLNVATAAGIALYEAARQLAGDK